MVLRQTSLASTCLEGKIQSFLSSATGPEVLLLRTLVGYTNVAATNSMSLLKYDLWGSRRLEAGRQGERVR